MPYLRIESEEIYYHLESGESDKTIVLLHSLGTDHRIWKYQVEAFSEKGYNVIVPDIRGHGKSSCHNGVSVDHWVTDLLHLLDHLKIEKSILCGVSMGGVMAIAFTLKYPERVQNLILADTFAKISPSSVSEKIELTAGVAKEQGMDQYADTYLDSTLSNSPSAKAIRHSLRQAISEMPLCIYESSAESCFRVNLEEQLSRIAVPSLVLIGEEDFKTPIRLSKLIVSKIPKAELRIIPKGRHLSNVDEPDYFNRSVIEFLNIQEKAYEEA
ncbi:alpha/beta fold hydrolase [Fictibacillus terranigra]|uniref:Alpha/beta fold hydrolase n=1 Tax=Fictibacillus terranigra TaxID=3058424 RepID=A0ABT8EDZ1_9BACL|nr:alpha/beta fold hydrolase [Fictibacillus sp. CENA-BCM004]MDN4076039.1 alpha/beta fold hydrolase [Fictibacillus sp. CENA-BCM004]